MKAYLINRTLLVFLTLFGMSIVIFILLRLAPGNIVDILFDSAGYVDPAEKKVLEAELGLDKPVYVQYGAWMAELLSGNLGKSYRLEIPAGEVIRPRIPVSLELALLAFFFSIILGIPPGVISAVRQDTAMDYTLRVISLSGLSMPAFWLGLLIILAFVYNTDLSPIYINAPTTFGGHVLLFGVPAFVVGFRSSALLMRLTRSSMLEVMRQDYIRTAKSKGLAEQVVNYRHALKNAILPVVTLLGIEAAFLMGGLVVTESVFNIPGVARFLVQAILWRDYPIVQNLVMFIAIIVVVVNFLTDLTYTWLDPRLQLTGKL
ncbi:MAG: ABC transporter permease [Candidatus Lambdaproteobacteria bacterium]|nr:ABC transporter permease [Candidatus Lambdaproteobacteria bacterium]